MTHTKQNDLIVIYTDGGCWPNPGVGGWGAVITIPGQKPIELTGGENPSTNNRMELLSAIAALEFLDPRSNVLLCSDSQYVVNGITDWIEGWKNNNWIGAHKKPVKNRDLWQRLDRATQLHTVTFEWVRGHAGVGGNERADALARKAAETTCGYAIDFSRYEFK